MSALPASPAIDLWNSQPLSTWTCDELLSRFSSAAYDIIKSQYRLAPAFKPRVLAIIEEQQFDGTDLIMLYSEAHALHGEALRAVMVKFEWLPDDFRRINQIEVRKSVRFGCFVTHPPLHFPSLTVDFALLFIF